MSEESEHPHPEAWYWKTRCCICMGDEDGHVCSTECEEIWMTQKDLERMGRKEGQWMHREGRDQWLK